MIAQIRPAEFDTWCAQARDTGLSPVVLDVREAWELQTASVNAGDAFRLVHIPMGQVPARLQDLPPDTPIACLCHHGARSQRVALFLAERGYTRVVNIAGGIDTWSRERDPSVPFY